MLLLRLRIVWWWWIRGHLAGHSRPAGTWSHLVAAAVLHVRRMWRRLRLIALSCHAGLLLLLLLWWGWTLLGTTGWRTIRGRNSRMIRRLLRLA